MQFYDLQQSNHDLHRSTRQEHSIMSNSSHSTQVHNIACSNRNSCHPILLCLGLTYVFFFVWCLVGSTCFDRRCRMGIRDVESKLGRRGDGKKWWIWEDKSLWGQACSVKNYRMRSEMVSINCRSTWKVRLWNNIVVPDGGSTLRHIQRWCRSVMQFDWSLPIYYSQLEIDCCHRLRSCLNGGRLKNRSYWHV